MMLGAIRRETFRSMGTTVELVTGASEPDDVVAEALARTRATFAEWDLRCSRFRGDSEITLANLAAGRPVRLSRELAEVVRFALDAARRTEGRFDPTVLDAVIAAGYDRDFDEVLAGARGALRPARPCGRWPEVSLDGDVLHLPEGVGLDLGGVAKGWTVDLAAEGALGAGLAWALVGAGGDLRLVGAPPEPGIEVVVEDPLAAEDEIDRLTLLGGALASSSVMKRSWGPGLQHLIDPTTGAPASRDILQATVWAPTCAEAEVLAKRALLEGELALEHICAVLVTDDRVLSSMPRRVAVAA